MSRAVRHSGWLALIALALIFVSSVRVVRWGRLVASAPESPRWEVTCRSITEIVARPPDGYCSLRVYSFWNGFGLVGATNALLLVPQSILQSPNHLSSPRRQLTK